MRKLSAVLDKWEMERLIYNDLDPLKGYPDYLNDNGEEEKLLKKRLDKYLVEGEYVEWEPQKGYAMTNFGRVFSGKRTPMIKVARSDKEFFVVLNGSRYKYSEVLPSYDFDETLERLNKLNYPVSVYKWK